MSLLSSCFFLDFSRATAPRGFPARQVYPEWCPMQVSIRLQLLITVALLYGVILVMTSIAAALVLQGGCSSDRF